jgi:hypothetical protein
MSFGFPAYHQQAETFNLPNGDLAALIRSALEELGWKITADSPSYFEASVMFNLWSWGEKISVSIEGLTVEIVSKGVMPTQCLDWGKNKKNVTVLLNTLRKLEHFENAKLSPAAAPVSISDGISPLTRLIAESDE